MRRLIVESSALRSIGYDAAQHTLELEFKQGGVWRYFNLPPKIYQRFIAARSLGRFFVQKIKGKFQEAKIA